MFCLQQCCRLICGFGDIHLRGRRSSEARRLKKAYETPLKIRRSEEVGHNLFPAGYRADDASDSEEETSVYEKKTSSLSAAQAQKKRAVLNNQVQRTSGASTPPRLCHIWENPCVEVHTTKPASSKAATQNVPKNKTVTGSQVGKPVQKASRPGVAKVDPKPRPSPQSQQKGGRPGAAKVNPSSGPSRQLPPKASQPGSQQSQAKGRRPGAAKVDPRSKPSPQSQQKGGRPGAVKVNPSSGPSHQLPSKASRPGSKQSQPKGGRPGAAKVDPRPKPSPQSQQKGGRPGVAKVNASSGPSHQLPNKASRPGSQQSQQSQAKASRPGAEKGPRPNPSKQHVLEASRLGALQLKPQPSTSKQDVVEASRPNSVELDAQPGTSKPWPASAKPKNYYQQTATRAVQTYSSSESDSEKRKKEQQITPKDCPARSVFELLATATVVASGERHSFTPLEDLRDRYIDVLYQKFLEERNGSLGNPPSPAPQDPELNSLRRVYVDRFEGFVPTLNWLNAFQDPRIIDFILERDKPESLRSLLHKKFPPRRKSLPNIVGYRYKHSALLDNILLDEYDRPMIINQQEPITENKGKRINKHYGGRIVRSRSLPCYFDDYFRSIYDEPHPREYIYDRTLWFSEPSEEEIMI